MQLVLGQSAGEKAANAMWGEFWRPEFKEVRNAEPVHAVA